MWPVRRILKIGLVAAAIGGTTVSVISNDFTFTSNGLVRFGRAAITVLDISLNYKLNLYSKEAKLLDRSSSEYKQLKSKIHRMSAEKLLELCRANKGVYVKIGQHIGALQYLLPEEYVDVMKVLHSQAPCSSLEEILSVIKEELKKDPSELFMKIEPQPLGTASLAQVHKAFLLDGSVVALKVQHPHIQDYAEVDMKTMEVLIKAVSWIFPDFNIQWLVNETKKNMPLELNFLKEAENTEKVRKMFQDLPWLKIPAILMELSTTRLLTMEFVQGGQINDLDYINRNQISPTDISDKLGQLYSQMIFIEGFVHSDPHPGNILVRKSDKGFAEIILLDHGLYATLSDDVRWAYAKLWLSILNQEVDGMKKHCTELGVGEGDIYAFFSCMVAGRTWDAILAGLNKKKYSQEEKEMFQKEIPNFISTILTILANVNTQMLLILKTNDLIRGIEHTLKTQARNISFYVMSEYCIKSVFNERLQFCSNWIDRVVINLKLNWNLFKLVMYYNYLSFTSFF